MTFPLAVMILWVGVGYQLFDVQLTQGLYRGLLLDTFLTR